MIIKSKRINKDQLREAVTIAFSGDQDLIDKYHVINGNLDEAIKDTLYRIEDVTNYYDLVFYKVIFNKMIIGFFTVEKNGVFLNSFGIAYKYRKDYILKEWWELVKHKLQDDFKCILNSKNERAIKFLIKNGMREFERQIMGEELWIIFKN